MSPLALILTALSFLIIAACFCAVVDYALCQAAAKPRPNLPASLGTPLDAVQDQAMRLGNEERCPIYDQLAADMVIASAETVFAEAWKRHS